MENKKNCRHKVFSPLSCGMAHPAAHCKKCGDFISLESFLDIIRHKSVQTFTDNSNVVRIMGQGSKDLRLNKLYSELSHSQWNTTLLSTWVPRNQNKIADGLTHLEDPCDWTLNADVFQKSLHSGAFLPLTVLQATPMIYLTGSTLCCGSQVQSVSMRLLKETDQNISTGASHLST